MDIVQRKQLDRLIMEEVNVKELARVLGDTEEGTISLVFDGENYFFNLPARRVAAKDETVLTLLNKNEP